MYMCTYIHTRQKRRASDLHTHVHYMYTYIRTSACVCVCMQVTYMHMHIYMYIYMYTCRIHFCLLHTCILFNVSSTALCANQLPCLTVIVPASVYRRVMYMCVYRWMGDLHILHIYIYIYICLCVSCISHILLLVYVWFWLAKRNMTTWMLEITLVTANFTPGRLIMQRYGLPLVYRVMTFLTVSTKFLHSLCTFIPVNTVRPVRNRLYLV